jgi:hypothetical protein
MRLKRRREPELDRDEEEIADRNSALIAEVFVVLDQAMEVYADLSARSNAGASADELRPEALRTAREIAYIIRACWQGMLNLGLLGDSLPDGLAPAGALRVLARLGYALIALSEDDPLPDTLISPEELDGLFAKHDIEDWAKWCRALQSKLEAKFHE